MQKFKKVKCPACERTLSHYIEGSGMNAIYRNICPKCGETIIIYSAGKTAIISELTIELYF